MNLYIQVINEAVEYIENNISNDLPLAELSSRFGISDFYFNRIFKAVTGTTVKQYILGRKLTTAMIQLKSTNHSVIDIALKLGFDYPEVFSRAFKRQFGISPANFRDNHPALMGVPKLSIIERDMVNYHGLIVLKGKIQFLEEVLLRGVSLEVNYNSNASIEYLKSEVKSFLVSTSELDSLVQDNFYLIVQCHGKDNGEYTIFCGKKLTGESHGMALQEYTIPTGWYVGFEYHEDMNKDMNKMRQTLSNDIYRWILVKGAKLNTNGMALVSIHSGNYPKNNAYQALIPVKKQHR